MLAEQTAFSLLGVFRRALARSVAWIPDVSTVPPRKLAAIGATASLIFHLLVLLAFLISAMVLPKRQDLLAPAARPEPLTVTIRTDPETPPAPPRPKTRDMIDADGLQKSDVKPKNVEFESSQDMIAGTEKPANGQTNLPGQDGRTDLPGIDFADQTLRVGVIPNEDTPPPSEAQPNPNNNPPAPEVKPLYKVTPFTPDDIARGAKASPTDELPKPATETRATPPPKVVPKDRTLALLQATPTPAPERGEAVTPATQPRPRESLNDRYTRSLQMKSLVETAITTQGRPGVNAINTPMGRYRRRLSMQIQSIWTQKVQEQFGLGTSTVRIVVRIDSAGHVQRTQVMDDGHNPSHTELCLRAIREMRPEPLPPDAEPYLDNGALEIAFSFTLL